MAVTPQTNVTISEFAEYLKQAQSVAICGHVNPDGDCIGSQLALGWALKVLGKDVTVLLAKPEPVELGLRFLPGTEDLIPAIDYDGTPDAFVATDVPIPSRLGDADAVRERAGVRFTIDHHAVDSVMSEYNYVDPDAPAAGMLVWDLIQALGVEPTPEMATCTYVALMTDTGRFQYQNATAKAFRYGMDMIEAGANPAECSEHVYQSRRLESLDLERIMLNHLLLAEDGSWALSYLKQEDFDEAGAVKADAEPLIDVIRAIHGVKVACILRDSSGHVRGSLRAKGHDIDVSALARFIGGGGHKAAAGFTFEGTIDEAREALPGYLTQLTQGTFSEHKE